ncbi:MAG: ROK family transcriptional regulator [Oscillospiraceae bacterium]|nr:ROK family transcriptional regulator [Oscillospiraceae bacterium]
MTESTVQARPVSVRSRIYRTLYEQQDFYSRQSLAQSCGISMPTLYQNLNELMEAGLVCYSGEERSTGGRRAQGLDIVPDARVSVGISVTEHHLRLVAADLRLRELAYKAVRFDTTARLNDGADELAAVLERFLDEFGIDRRKLLGVGVTIPALMSPDSTHIQFAPTLGLRDVPVDGLLGKIPYPLYVDNDGSASGHAECFVRRGQKEMAYLSLEYGVGGAVLIDGKLHRGAKGHSGEFGHICVEPGGLHCNCGKQGCLEAYCSPLRVEKTLGVSLEEFFRGVEEHIPEYEALLYDMLRHLAVAVNAIRLTLDCDVILGGFFSEYLQPYLPVLRRYVLAGNPFEPDADFVQLSSLRRHITPLGAALYFIREFVAGV